MTGIRPDGLPPQAGDDPLATLARSLGKPGGNTGTAAGDPLAELARSLGKADEAATPMRLAPVVVRPHQPITAMLTPVDRQAALAEAVRAARGGSGVPAFAPRDVSQVGAPASTPLSVAQAFGLSNTSLVGRTANVVGEMAAHPLETAEGMVTAPAKALYTLARSAAEQEAANDLAMSGGQLGDYDPTYGQSRTAVERTVTPKEAGIAGAQVGAMLAAPELGEAGGIAGRLLGGRVGGVAGEAIGQTSGRAIGHLAGASATGAAFMPNDPAVGAVLGGVLGAPWSDAARGTAAVADRVRPRVSDVAAALRDRMDRTPVEAPAVRLGHASERSVVPPARPPEAPDAAAAPDPLGQLAESLGKPPASPKEATAEAISEAAPAPRTSSVTTLPTSAIRVDPARFQFKLNTNPETGTGAELAGVRTFDPDLAGVVSVWRDPADGETYVVNGHHRVELANRLGVPTLDVRYIDAPTAEAARAKGALINIAEGRGTSLDAAKFFRDTGASPETLDAAGISLRGAVARNGLGLSKLDPTLFDRVARGEIPEDTGAAIGKVLDAPEQQRAAVQLIEQSGRKLAPAEAENVARQVRDAGSTSVTQETLFGEESTPLSLAVDRARLAEAFKKDLARDKRVLGYVANEGRAETLAKAGNVINADESARLAQQSAGLTELFDRLSSRSGPIGDILTEGARRLANGERLSAVKADLGDRLHAAVSDVLAQGLGGRGEPVAAGAGLGESAAAGPGGGAGAGGGAEDEAPPFVDPNQGGIFGAYVPEGPDLFGESRGATSEQGGLFGEREGTAASRNLAQTEAAARAEIDQLRQRYALTQDAGERQGIAARIARLERLTNRSQAIGADELRARLEAERAGERAAPPDQAGLFDANAPIAGTASGTVLSGPRTPETPDVAVRHVNGYVDAFRRAFDPTARGPEAALGGRIIRSNAAAFAQRLEHAVEATKAWRHSFDGMPVADQLAFIDRMEKGEAQPTPDLTRAAATLRSLLDDARDEIRALGTGKLEHWIQNYFPHLWRNPEAASGIVERILSKRSLEGPKSFLKKRSIPTTMDGIEAGLTPVSYNPVDLALLKLREMHRYILGQKILAEMKARGLVRFVNSLDKPPAGLQQIDDKIGTVYGPPKVTVSEAYDQLVVDKLNEVMRGLGVTHTRSPAIGGQRLGFAIPATSEMATRSATPESVIMHELGHIVDKRLNLWQRLHEYPGDPKSREAIDYRKQVDGELRALADLRYEGMDAPAGFRQYVRIKEEKMANAITALLYAPDRMKAAAPTVMGTLRDVLASNPATAKLLDVKPSLVYGMRDFDVKTPGVVVLGHHYAPEPVTRVLNNFLSPGLRGNPYFDLYRGVGNVLNMAQLGLSAFHLGFTSMDATVSRVALGLEQIAAGRLGEASRSFVSAPAAPFTTLVRGDKVLREYLRPGTQGGAFGDIVDALVQGGGRVRMDSFYKTGAIDGFFRNLRDARAADIATPARAVAVAKAGAFSVPALFETAAKPVLEWWVPRQKLGVFADLAQLEMSRLPADAKPDMVREAMARAWDSVDNRMGQLVYDNLFWHRATKDLALASVRSVGWNVGTLRELGGGINDLLSPDRTLGPNGLPNGERYLTHKAAYVIALPITVGLAGGILHYLYTGHAPESLTDYYFPRTGRKNLNGTDERVQLPSYMRDVFDVARDPFQTIKNKAHPLVATVVDMLNNQDFYGHLIRNPDDPLTRQVAQEAHFLVQQFEPFGVRNYRQQAAREQPVSTRLQNFVGVTPAPRWMTKTDAEQRMAELGARRASGALTPEQVEARDTRGDILKALRAGRAGRGDAGADALAQLRAEVEAGDLSRQQAHTLRSGARVAPEASAFARLPLSDALDVYGRANAMEREQLRRLLVRKVLEAREQGLRLPPAERDSVRHLLGQSIGQP